MDYCQKVHDLRQCPVAVGSPQTQSQRDQVTRIIHIAELQEKRYRDKLSARAAQGTSSTTKEQQTAPRRFTFEGVTEEVEHELGQGVCDGATAINGRSVHADSVSSRGTKCRSESTDSSGSAVPSHPVKKSSSQSGHDVDMPSESYSSDQQPQKYQAVEPLRVKGKKGAGAGGSAENGGNSDNSDFASICPSDSSVTINISSKDPVDAEDRVTPVLQQGIGAGVAGVSPNPHLEPTDKSGNERHVRETGDCAAVTDKCSPGDDQKKAPTASPSPSSPSNWFWGSSSNQPKPPKESSQSSSSWKGSLKGLRKWSSAKMKSPPSTPTAASSECGDSEHPSRASAIGPGECDEASSIDDTRKCEAVVTESASSGSLLNSGDADECGASSGNRKKSSGRKWSLPNPLKKNTGASSPAGSPSAPSSTT